MNVLPELADLVRRECGIVLGESQYPALEAGIRRAGLDRDAIASLALGSALDRGAIDRLIDEIAVNETSFFRDRAQLEAIAWPDLLASAQSRGSRTVNVWSVGCATGEEAYTLAILASEAFAPGEPPVSVLATDISRAALGKARAGQYGSRAARDVCDSLRSEYFELVGSKLVVGERARRLVRFQRHNLVRDPIPPLGEAPFDLILCRNVLIYFDADTAGRTIDGLEQAVEPHGRLLLGSADALCTVGRHLSSIAVAVRSDPRQEAPSRTLRRPLGRQVESEERPASADASFLEGLVALEAGEPAAAVASFRRSLYVSPRFGLAAFELGRAHERLGEGDAARRAYEQALRIFAVGDEHGQMLEQIDPADVVAACRARLELYRS